MVEHQIVVLVVAGSSPVIHPSAAMSCTPLAFVAQLDRVADFESVGRRFESCRTRRFFYFGPLAQLVEQQTLNLRVKGSNPFVAHKLLTTARVVELADTLDLGSSTFGVRVQVPPLALDQLVTNR
jgi:hypothetical protein